MKIKKILILSLLLIFAFSISALAVDNVQMTVPGGITANTNFNVDVKLNTGTQNIQQLTFYVTSQNGLITFNSEDRAGAFWWPSASNEFDVPSTTINNKPAWKFKFSGSSLNSNNQFQQIIKLNIKTSGEDTLILDSGSSIVKYGFPAGTYPISFSGQAVAVGTPVCPASCSQVSCPAGQTGTPCTPTCNQATGQCGTCTPTCNTPPQGTQTIGSQLDAQLTADDQVQATQGWTSQLISKIAAILKSILGGSS